jgi:undecaprenyl-diphosphatase
VRWLSRPITTPRGLLLAWLASFAAILGAAIAAGKLLGLAEQPDGSTAFDRSITSWVVMHRSAGLTTLAHVFSTLGSQVVLAPVAVILTLGLVSRRHFLRAGLLLVAWAGAIGLYNIIKAAVGRPRPPASLWLTDVGRTSSFPSGHATQSLATFGAVALIATVWLSTARWPLRLLALVLALGVGWSRVYLGVHWTTDVLAGWLIATAWVALLFRWAQGGRVHAASPDYSTDPHLES